MLSFPNEDFTLSAWVKLDNLSDRRIILSKAEGTNTANQEYVLYYDDTQQRFGLKVVSSAGAGTTIWANTLGAPATNTWYHIVAWHDAGNDQLGIQVNGGTADTQAYANGVRDDTNQLRIGSQDKG